MTHFKLRFFFAIYFISLFCFSCSNHDEKIQEEKIKEQIKRQPQLQAEYIYRKSNESLFTLQPLSPLPPPTYFWNKNQTSKLTPITKEFFRCKGNYLNPYHVITINGETIHHYDCNGIKKHGLPLRDGKEFMFPILIELLNHIQDHTNQKIIITSGHRCPEHNTYVDASKENQTSKHMIGAEVSFYVHGMENQPEKIIRCIQEFYLNNQKYKGNKELQEFHRYDKNTDVTTQPWYNKEIFIKLFKKNEGRNFDNRHPYPYISLQVRHDRDLNQKVNYSWDAANKNYHRR